MARSLCHLLSIRFEEWPRLLLLYLMAFLFVAGAVLGTLTVEASFLQHVGVKSLPWFFMAKAILSIPAVAIYTAFADRVPNDKLLIAILLSGMMGIVVGLGLLSLKLDQIAYSLLYLVAFIPLEDILALQWYTFVNGLYDTQSIKRIIPILGTASRIAGFAAGQTLPILNDRLSSNSIILIWLSTLGAKALLVWLGPYILKEVKTARAHSRFALDTPVSRANLDHLRAGYRYVAQSAFLRWMALTTLVMVTLLAFLQYQYSQILLEEFKTAAGIASFLGRVTSIANLAMLPVQLLLLNRTIGRIGVGDASLIFPTGTLLSGGGLILAPGLPSAGLAFLGKGVFNSIFGTPINVLLYNAVPLRVKGRARAFIGGFFAPVGSFVGGLLLLLPFTPAPWLLPGLIGVLAVAFMASALAVRKQYKRALVEMLEQEDFSFLLSQGTSELTVTDPATLDQLQKKLQESTTHELTIFMAKLISQVAEDKAVLILEQAATAATDARTRAAILDVISSADLRSDAARQLYTDFLADPDGRVRQSAIAGLEQLTWAADEQFRSQMLGMIHDPDVAVGVRALAALARAGEFYQLTPAVQVLDRLLSNVDAQRRALGVRVLGQAKNERAARRLAEFLSDPADKVRLEAAIAVEALSQDTQPEHFSAWVVNEVRRIVHDPIERVRQAALVVLGRLGTPEVHPALVDALTDASPQVRATAVDALAQRGKSIIPLLHPQLSSPDPQLRKMAAVTLSRVNPREFGALISGSCVTENLLIIYGHYGLVEALAPCSRFPSITVLQSALRESSQQLADEILYLLSAVHDPNAVKIIRESLHSSNPRVRANAVEALESLTTPQTARLCAPLFEPELAPAQLLSLGQDTWDMEYPDTAGALQQLVTHPDDPWLRTVTTFALGEIGAAVLSEKDHGQSDAGPVAGKTGRSSLLADLTAKFKDTQGTEVPPPSDQFPFTRQEIEALLTVSLADPVKEVRLAAQTAHQMMAAQGIAPPPKEATVLSTIEKIIFLKGVPFFQGMTIEQLRALASVCEEQFFPADTRLFSEGDPGGVLYVVVNGRVGIEREKRKGSFARVATVGAHSYFGEIALFDNGRRSASAIAIQDTLTLRLRREPLIALARQHPDLSLELIKVLSGRLREANDRITELTRTRPRELQKLYDKLD